MTRFRRQEKFTRCGYCGRVFDLDTLRDQVSIDEWTISGMCQACQDEAFQEPKK